MDDIKIVQLRTGHHVISKIAELRTDDDQPLCFLLAAPMVLSYGAESNEENYTVKYTQWSPFSKSLEFRVPFEHVISVSEPKDSILEKYIEIVNPYYPLVAESFDEPTEEN